MEAVDGGDDAKEEPEEEGTLCGAFKLGRANLKIDRKGWLYLQEDVLSAIMQFVAELLDHGNVSDCKKVIVVGGMTWWSMFEGVP